MGKKITHVVKPVGLGGPFDGSGIGVYGRKDLAARKKAAKEAGVPLTVRKLKKGER